MIFHLPRNYRVPHVERLQQLEGRKLAPFWRRLVAFEIDLLLASLGLVPFHLLATLEAGRKTGRYAMDLDPFHGWSILILPLYFGLTAYFWNGKTIGKALLRIRIVSLAHERLGFWHSIERALGYGASTLEFGFGFLQYFTHPNGQTVHDRIAETIVVYEPKAAPPGAPAPVAPAPED